MLKELKDIGEYVTSIQSPIESLITVPGGEFYIISINFDGETFEIEQNVKEGDKNDLIDMCFKPGKAKASALLPNVYTGIDGEGNIEGFDKLENTLKILKSDFPILKDFFEKFKIFIDNIDFETLERTKNTLGGIQKKDKNKKLIMKILSLKFSINYTKTLGFNSLINANYLYFGQIEEFHNYFLSKNQGDGAEIINGFCHICENNKNDIIDFTNSTGVNFDYKFYNLDKPGFAYSIDKINGTKSFGVCQNCYSSIKSGYNYFKRNLSKNVLGSKAYIFPSIMFKIDQKNKIYEIIEKYSNIDILEEQIKLDIEQGKVTGDIFDLLYNKGKKEDQDVISENNFIKLNFLFGNIDGAKNDEFKIKYFLKDIMPSRLGSFYKSIKLFNRKFGETENEIGEFAKNFYSETNWLKEKYINLPDLYLYPTYEKNKYIFNLKNFFTINSNGDEQYYKFLDTYLHNGEYEESDFWSLVYSKLNKDFVDKYIKSKDGNLKISIREIYLVYQYLIYNNLLQLNLNPMTNISFGSENKGIIALENYFRQQSLFDSIDKVYIALVGFYIKLCINKQKHEIGSNPFITEINFERMNYESLLKLLNKAREKFNKYSAKKFAYYPELYKTILILKMQIKEDIKRDEMVYYFSIGMEILKDIYFAGLEKDENVENIKPNGA